MGDVKSVVLSNEKIVDRSEEQEIIQEEISNPRADATIIYAESGVGKSALTARIGRSTKNMRTITAVTRPENKGDKLEEGTFLTSIFNAFVRTMQKEKASHPKCSFEYYLSHNKSAIIKKNALEKMFNSVDTEEISQSVGWSISKYVLARIFHLYEYNSTALLQLRDRDSMLIASDYIRYVLSIEPILLIVDNVQNMDSYSLRLMIDWMLLSGSSSYFLLEYTTENRDDLSGLMDFAQHLKDYTLKLKLIGLPYLKSEDALRAVELTQPKIAETPSFRPAAKRFYETQSGGSMRKLLDYSLQYQERDPFLDLHDPIYALICSTSLNGQYILGIIIIHNGQIEETHLRGIIEHSIDPIVLNMDAALRQLETEKNLLERHDSGYQITHAQIGDAWNSHRSQLRKLELLAQRNSIAYYEAILHSLFSSTQRKEQALLFLIKAYAAYSPEKLGDLIEQLSYVLFDRLQPKQVWHYLSIFLEYIQGCEGNFVDTLCQIVRFCFDHNLYKNCLYVLERLAQVPGRADSDFYAIYKINCIEYLEYHEKAVELCVQRLSAATEDRSRYYYLLLLMGCYRSLNQTDNVCACVEQIKNIPGYDTYLEYGYFLRLSETYLSRRDALPLVSQSVQFFHDRQMDVQEIKSGITETFLMAVSGDLSKAYQELGRYEEMASQMHLFGNVFELNKASMLLLKGMYGQEVGGLLKKAELSTNSPFDRLLILTMQLINNTECNQLELTESLLPHIEALLEREGDKHLISLVSYDLYCYYKRIGQEEQAEKYRQIAQATAAHNHTVRCRLAGKKNPLTPNLFQVPWSVGFTFFWSIDYEGAPATTPDENRSHEAFAK